MLDTQVQRILGKQPNIKDGLKKTLGAVLPRLHGAFELSFRKPIVREGFKRSGVTAKNMEKMWETMTANCPTWKDLELVEAERIERYHDLAKHRIIIIII